MAFFFACRIARFPIRLKHTAAVSAVALADAAGKKAAEVPTMDLRSARATVQRFGRQVRAYRKAAGITQIELGRLSLVLLADALGCSVVDLLKD